jgi:fumarylacetoacetase
MKTLTDATHDPALRSWVASANDGRHRLPDPEPAVRPLPRKGSDEPWRIGVAIGDQVLDLRLAAPCNAPGAEVRRCWRRWPPAT